MLVYIVGGTLSFIAVAGALHLRSLIFGLAPAPLRRTRAGFDEGARGRLRSRDHERVSLETVDDEALNWTAQQLRHGVGGAVKRTLDIVLSLGLLIFLSPVMAMAAIAIRLDSPGPIFYRQRRVGLGGAEFDVIKFRSMVENAEPNGARYAEQQDSRVTRVGYHMRRMRIDEIPQAINVLHGEMSFVGPRPERPEFVRRLEQEIPHYQSRHLVKPGITGWAQVKYEYAASVAGAREKLRYDLFYVEQYSPLMDLRITIATIKVVLFGLGSR